jgi:hypothetical protein
MIWEIWERGGGENTPIETTLVFAYTVRKEIAGVQRAAATRD